MVKANESLEEMTKKMEDAKLLLDNFYQFHKVTIDEYNRLQNEVTDIHRDVILLQCAVRSFDDDSPF